MGSMTAIPCVVLMCLFGITVTVNLTNAKDATDGVKAAMELEELRAERRKVRERIGALEKAAREQQRKPESLPYIQDLQRGLSELGFDPGAADGVLGERTREAIRAFQRDNNTSEDGEYSTILLLEVQKKADEVRKRKEEIERLLALSDEEFLRLVENSNREEFLRLIDLVGERANDLPVRTLLYAMAPEKSEAVKNLVNVVFVEVPVHLMLPALMYQFTDVEDGVRQFQRDLGEKETGELTWRQLDEMQRRKARLYETPVYLVGSERISLSSPGEAASGRAFALGTWVPEGEELASPIRTSEITCVRDVGTCNDSTAFLPIPSIEDSSEEYLLMVESRSWHIVSWDRSGIVARSENVCETSVLTLGLEAGEVYEVVTINRDPLCKSSAWPPPMLRKPKLVRLVPGFKLSKDYWKKRRASSPSFYPKSGS